MDVGEERYIPLDGLAERLVGEDLSLGLFSDEELAAVDLPPHPQGASGWFATLDDDGRAIARTAATRSLLTRGLLRPGGRDGQLEVHPSLVLLRSARQDALAVTLVDRHGPGGHERALYHLVAAGVVLEELLDADGLHACTVRSLRRASASLAARCDPDGAARAARGTDRPGPGDAPEAPDAERLVSEAVWRTELATVRRTGRDASTDQLVQAALTVAATPSGVWAVGPVPSDGDAEATEVAARDLPSVVAAILDPPAAPGAATA